MEKVTKEVSGGKAVYRDQEGEEIRSYDEDLPTLAEIAFSPLRDFLDMPIEGEDPEAIIYITKALLERAEEKINTAMDYLWNNFGQIRIERACATNRTVKSETILGVTFKPCAGVTP
jgi:hypothetical protein